MIRHRPPLGAEQRGRRSITPGPSGLRRPGDAVVVDLGKRIGTLPIATDRSRVERQLGHDKALIANRLFTLAQPEAPALATTHRGPEPKGVDGVFVIAQHRFNPLESLLLCPATCGAWSQRSDVSTVLDVSTLVR